MVNNKQYESFISKMKYFIEGLKTYKTDMNLEISEKYYLEELERLDKQRRKLEKRKSEFIDALKEFNERYSIVRRSFGKDKTRVKRVFEKDRRKLLEFGIHEPSSRIVP